MTSFPCTSCGCCCKHVDRADRLIVDDVNNPLYFPYSNTDGRCEKLTSDNKCSVYDSRPLVCNIDEMIKRFGLDRDEHYELNKNICNQMMDEDKIDLKYRIL